MAKPKITETRSGLKKEIAEWKALAVQQCAAADRYYTKLKELADIAGIQQWTVKSLPRKMKKRITQLEK